MNKISGLNSVPTSKLSEQVFGYLGIELGLREKEAWKQRNVAAHGDIKNADAVATIKNTKLLRIILHRLLFKMTNASDIYRDYYTIGFPIRKLNESVP